MILWVIISGGMFYGTFWGKTAKVRRGFSIVLTAWVLFSLALHMLGGPNLD